MSDLAQIALIVGADYAGSEVEVEIHDGAVWLSRGQDHVSVAPIEGFLGPMSEAEALIANVTRGTALLILVGNAPHDKRRALVNKGVYDVLSDPVDPFRLCMAVRNAFDLQGVRARSTVAARLVKRNRYELREMIESARVISSKRSIQDLLETILKKCREITHADAGTVYVVRKSGEGGELQAKIFENDSIDVAGREFEIPLSRDSLAGQAALDRTVINIADVRSLPAGMGYRHDDSVDARTGYHTRSVIMAPMLTQTGEVLGVVQLINCKRDPFAVLWEPEDFDKNVVPFDSRAVEIVRTLTAHAGVSLETAQLYEDIQRAFDGFVDAAVEAIEQRDPTTSGHSKWVTRFTIGLAECVDRTTEGHYADVHFTEEEMRELRYAAVLHDFGKIGVPEAVLKKEKKLPEGWLQTVAQRFESARLSLKLQHLKRLAELTMAGEDGQTEWEAAARHINAALEELDAFWDLVVRANEPTVLPKDKEAALDDLAKVVFLDTRGQEQRLLTDEEHAYLSIPRGSLSHEEFEKIKSHARKTDEFLSKIPWGESLKNIPFIASSHHERLDGSGYPRRLLDEQIPLKAKMMAIADIYDALTASDRPYKKAVPVERALAILQDEVKKGGLDGELVELFVECRVFDRDSHHDAEPVDADEP